MKLIAAALFIFLSHSLLAGDCEDLVKCSQAAAKLTGVEYIFPAKLNVRLKSTDQFKLNSENADSVFSALLFANDLTRIPLSKDKKVYKVVSTKDITTNALPVLHMNLNSKIEEIPDRDDFYTLEYYFSRNDTQQPMFAVYGIRQGLSRYGKVYSIGKTLLVHDSARKLKAAFKIAKGADRELSAEFTAKALSHLRETEKFYKKKNK